MTTYALTETADGTARVLRLREFDGAPPILPPEKGMEWVEWIETPQPAFDPLTEGVRELEADLLSGRAVRVWQVYPLPDEEVAANRAALVPGVVTMRQARLALHLAGLLPKVSAALAALPEPARTEAQIEWEYATEVQRHYGLVLSLGPALGIDDATLDALFTHAATL